MKKKNKIIITIIVAIILLIGISVVVREIRISRDPELKRMYDEWTKCKNKELSQNYVIDWKIRIKSMDIGGLVGVIGGRGYIYGNRSCSFQWVLHTDNESSKNSKLEFGLSGLLWGWSDIAIIKGECVGGKGDLFINVQEMEVVKKFPLSLFY